MNATLVLVTLLVIRLIIPFTVLMLVGTLVNRKQVQMFG